MRTGAILVVAALLTTASAGASATSPLTFPAQESWTRTVQGDVLYVATDPKNHLAAVCVGSAGRELWLPPALFADIGEVALEKIELVRGMGFAKAKQFLPDQAMWGLSVEIPTYAVDSEDIEDGPNYSFVVHAGAVPWRVHREWVPMPEGPRPPGISRRTNDGVESFEDEQWLAIDPASVRAAPCTPPQAPAFTYLWSDELAVDVDLDRDGAPDHARLGLGNFGYALQLRVGGKDLPLIEIPADASQQFGVCPADEEPTLRVQAHTPAPREALGELPPGYELCEDCREIVVAGGECDPLHFYWNAVDDKLGWWRS